MSTCYSASSPMNLAMIRKAAQMTQVEVARKLGVGQGAISRLANRADMLLSTLYDYLTATGAEAASIVVTVRGHKIELAILMRTVDEPRTAIAIRGLRSLDQVCGLDAGWVLFTRYRRGAVVTRLRTIRVGRAGAAWRCVVHRRSGTGPGPVPSLIRTACCRNSGLAGRQAGSCEPPAGTDALMNRAPGVLDPTGALLAAGSCEHLARCRTTSPDH
jgi:transcriptional regulator with XRE-family HTH domain